MQDSNNFHDDEIRLKDIILKVQELKSELLSSWKVVFITSFLFTVLGFLYSINKQAIYKAELNFVLEDDSGGGGMLSQYSGLASQFGFDLGVSKSSTFTESNILELLMSRRVVEEALLAEVSIDGKKDILINYHIDFNNYREKWSEKVPGIKTLVYHHHDRNRFTILQDSVLRLAWKNLTEQNVKVQLNDDSNIISVICQSKNELFAKLLVEELVAEVKEYYTYTQTAKARNTLDFIQNRADSVLNELKLAEFSYARHKDSNFGVMRAEGLLEELRLKREVEILNVMYGEIIKNLEISKVTLLNQKPLINVIDFPRFPLEVFFFTKFQALVLFGFLGAILASIYIICAFLIRGALETS
tara:strand:- start:4190 stop:5263 length:1074 start_codon:yes stop_codon:yes gene_type:complete